MAIVAAVTPDTTPPSVTVVVTGGTGVVNRVVIGSPNVSTPVRGTDAAFTGTILDYECPQETLVYYTFPGVASAFLTMPDVGEWLFPVGHPELAVRLKITGHDGWETPGSQDIVRIPGREFPVVVSWGVRGAASGKFEVTTASQSDEDALKAVLADQATCFLTSHAGHGLSGYMAIGDVSWSRQVAYSRDQVRKVSLPYTMVDRPEIITANATHRIVDLVGTISGLAGTWAQQ
jgi:hypothetical protein